MLYTGFARISEEIYYRPTNLKELFPLNSREININLVKIMLPILQKWRERQVLLCDIRISIIPSLKLKLSDMLVLDKPNQVEKLRIHNDRYNRGNRQLVYIEDQ